MEPEITQSQLSLYQSYIGHDTANSLTATNPDQQFTGPKDSSASMIDPNNEPQALFTQESLHEDYGLDQLISTLIENHIWLIGLLTGIIIILVVLSCSLRSNYFQENYFFTRAKEWVHLPLLQQSGQDSLPTAEAGTNHNNVTSAEPEPNLVSTPAQHAVLCSWVSETSPDEQHTKMKSSWAETEQNNQQNFAADMSALLLTETKSEELEPIAHPTTPIPCDASLESLRNSFKSQKNHFVFNADIFLTKSESLDEARSHPREKCFKANRSVDELLPRQDEQLADSSPSEQQHMSTSSIPCTPQKCRKLQERRGSNHSLTIAVNKPVETNILPTVVTPRECSAAQFLLTAGNCMDRRQLQSCLKDVKSLHAEFWSIPNNAAELSEQVSGCSVKNRYRYVLPNPQSRVKLPVTTNSSDLASGYINANYIRAENGDARAYIATQGPLDNTINDFWLMVWAERAPAIVMITKLVESGKTKCEPYLPADGETCRYGDVIVTLDSVEEASGCTVRQLSLKRDGEEEIHHLTHYWYSDWPDHKTPDNPRTLVDLAVTIESMRRGRSCLLLSSPLSSPPTESGPIVVHCSAGVGRTGCFIAICQGLSQLLAEGKVDILGIVCSLRCDRGGMVQTAEQYEFIHRALCLFEKSTLSDYAGD
ncbi:Protein tyrosine phosphatase ERK-like protein [Daphnia magna]|uniref:protein-tyrosine-phosphatase n=1 Tax=Daphnia magna TaxID=35525 RepID=A0A164SRQ5_9CRUS|nr:Protein tyrosine phosphatase ERK-like protein [Daphnia magna]